MHLILKKTILSRTRNTRVLPNKELWPCCIHVIVTFLIIFLNENVEGAINQDIDPHTVSLVQFKSVNEVFNEHGGYDKTDTRLLEISGTGFLSINLNDGFVIKPTISTLNCNNFLSTADSPNEALVENIKILNQTDNTLTVLLKYYNNLNDITKNILQDDIPYNYLCIRENYDSELRHMGIGSKFESLSRRIRSLKLDDVKEKDSNLIIDGYRIEHADKEPTLDDVGVPSVLSHSHVTLRLFGNGLNEHILITFTQESNVFGGSCQLPATKIFKIHPGSVTKRSALVHIELPNGEKGEYFYFCAKVDDTNTNSSKFAKELQPFIHQGSDTWLRLSSYEPFLPLWASMIIICVCLMFSALFSGLNLGLMSLDRTDLKILCNTGTEQEKKYARAIQPVRDHGNFLLCSILLGNVLVNSTFTILLDSLTSGLVAVICSTIAIVIFGEITPQAICSRHGLAVGAKTIMVTKAVMLFTFPLAYPTSKILDVLLGEEIGNFYNRERLKELVKVTTDVNDLDKDEVNIISGVLELRKKSVEDIMTRIEDAFMLRIDAVLDFETVSEIMKSGFSRVPVYEDDRKNIVTLLYIKDLAFVDPDDNTPLRTLCEFYQNPCHFVFEDVTLDVMFKQFKEGHKGHMAFVHRVNNEGDGDPFYETIGLVTLEDVIEELIQAEIMDETDVFTDNRTKVRRTRPKRQDFTVFAQSGDNKNPTRPRISPQLTLATFQYLSTSVDAFKPDMVSETILRRLLNQDIVHHIKSKGKDKNDPSMIIIGQGKPVDFFILILEGRVEVTVGKESLVFESGSFTYFGTQALIQAVGVVDSPQQQIMGSLQSLNMDALLRHTFIPDYSVKAVTDVIYIVIKRNLYLAAKRATLMERSQRLVDPSTDAIDDEVEKLLHSLDEDDRSVGADTANLTIHTPKASKPTSNAPSPTMVSDQIQSNGPSHNSISLLSQNAAAARSHSLAAYPQRPDGSTTPLLPRSKS